ncbi:PP2C family protein-serine/threonine phosphatase [Streptomyces sp. NPDC127039]|uniref:PP2C family protein-serine/threonine phosphatase n=1 Tax=Streptomyces sp. NPDC127039 TaxID=3347115 RepID=UPI00365D17A2
MDEYDLDAVLQQSLDRLTLLNQISAAMSSTLDAVEGLGRVCRVLVPALADWCVADMMDDGGRLERVCFSHRDTGTDAAGPAGALPPPPQTLSTLLARVLRGGVPLLLTADLLSTGQEASGLSAAMHLELFDRLAAESAIVAPLRARRRALGGLVLVRDSGRRPFDDVDVALVEDLTHRMALAVDNARLHAEANAIAERLQRSLLPELSDSGGLRVTARYAPAAATAEVGGDWYDSFVLPQGDTTLIIGDVSGHDLRAAVTMSQLRNMLRGIACDRQEPPGIILRRLDTAMETLYPHRTATCVYGLLKGPQGGPYQLEWSRAGHPPPLLVTEDGDTNFLREAHGLLLGVDPRAERASAVTPLPAGSTLLLYTDGLIERRGEWLGHGMTRLRQHAAALVTDDLDTMCDEMIDRLAAESDDDIALLALRLPPSCA